MVKYEIRTCLPLRRVVAKDSRQTGSKRRRSLCLPRGAASEDLTTVAAVTILEVV